MGAFAVLIEKMFVCVWEKSRWTQNNWLHLFYRVVVVWCDGDYILLNFFHFELGKNCTKTVMIKQFGIA